MFAVQYPAYGNPDVLELGDAPEPHAGPGQVRVVVHAASVNPFDCKVRAGLMAQSVPRTFPAIPGVDAAGVVDEVGEGVGGVQVGDAVFGLGDATTAEYAVLGAFAGKPEELSFVEAAGLGTATESAARCLDLLALPSGSTVLVDGAAGGVGTALVQLAVARGLRVVGTASTANHDHLRGLGAEPIEYGPGLAGRVRSRTDRVDGAIDLAGRGSVPELVAIVGDPGRVVTLADFTAYPLGVHVADGSQGSGAYALAEAAELVRQGRFRPVVDRVFPLEQAAEAHRLVEGGHVRGKVIVAVIPAPPAG